MLLQILTIASLVAVSDGSTSPFSCVAYTEQCQCLGADKGQSCVWCPSAGCVDRPLVNSCPVDEEEQLAIAHTCSSTNTTSAARGLEAGIDGTNTLVLTNDLTDGVTVSKHGSTVSIPLGKYFSIDFVNVTFFIHELVDQPARIDELLAFSAQTKIEFKPATQLGPKRTMDACTRVPPAMDLHNGLDLTVTCMKHAAFTVNHVIVETASYSHPYTISLEDVHVGTRPYQPVDGLWTPFSPWSMCSNTCGNGNQSRARTCDNPAPEFGGLDCDGPSELHRECHDNTGCPTDWKVVAIIGWWQLALLIVVIVRQVKSYRESRHQKQAAARAEELVDDVFEDPLESSSWVPSFYKHAQSSFRWGKPKRLAQNESSLGEEEESMVF